MAKKKIAEALDFGEENSPQIVPQIEVFEFDLNKVTKTEIARLTIGVINGITEGLSDPIREFLKAKAMNEISAKVLESLKPFVIKEMKGEKSFKTHGLELQITQGAKKYDFSDDSMWFNMNQTLETIKNNMKIREDLMIKAMDFANVVDDDGEIIPPATIKSYNEDALKTIIPK